MRLCSIASGSSGNCIYVGGEKNHIIIDAGISTKRIVDGLKELSVMPEELSGILITHEHIDHVAALRVFSKKYAKPIYGTKGTIKGIIDSSDGCQIDKSLFREIEIDKEFSIDEFTVHPFAISHDANEPCAYVVRNGKAKVAVATDMGHYTNYTINELSNLDALLLEANHDVKMLEVGTYPYYLKQRILGDKGHLSNENSGKLLSQLLHDNFKGVLLGHLSKENNYERLAYETVKAEITLSDCPYNGGDFPIFVAKRDCMSDIIYV